MSRCLLCSWWRQYLSILVWEASSAIACGRECVSNVSYCQVTVHRRMQRTPLCRVTWCKCLPALTSVLSDNNWDDYLWQFSLYIDRLHWRLDRTDAARGSSRQQYSYWLYRLSVKLWLPCVGFKLLGQAAFLSIIGRCMFQHPVLNAAKWGRCSAGSENVGTFLHACRALHARIRPTSVGQVPPLKARSYTQPSTE